MSLATARKLLLPSLLILTLAGCKTLTPWSDNASASSQAATQIFDPVPNYTKAPCEHQRKWAAHNSKVATLREGHEVVYKAPCDVPKPTAPKPATPPAADPPPPKTS